MCVDVAVPANKSQIVNRRSSDAFDFCILSSYTFCMTEFPRELADCVGFQWDAGNADKSWQRYRVSRGECEQVFFQRPLLIATDERHSQAEARYAALGQTVAGRRLLVVFTVRKSLIRVISVRTMSRRERRAYERAEAE